jgi:Bacteriophage head to tail connecting protein
MSTDTSQYSAGVPRIPTDYEMQIVSDSMREFSELQTWRNVFAAHWEETAELVLPTSRNTFYFGNFNWPGQKKTDRQIDATGMMALHRFGAICDSLLTPRNMMWHTLTNEDEYVMKDRKTRLWFEQVNKILFKFRYSPMANFASQNQNNYQQLGAFGNMGMFIDELDMYENPGRRGLRYKSMPLGQLFIRENHQGIVDGFIRWFRLTARQAFQKWGQSGRFPEVLRTSLDKNSEQLFNFIHRVCPRYDYEPGRLDAKGKPYASYYISLEGKSLCQEGGYRMIPAAISRYEQGPDEVYGRGPAMMVLPSLKTLNAEKRTFLKAGHRAVDPVLLTGDDGIVGLSLRPGAINKGGINSDGKRMIDTLPVGNIQISEKMMDEERSLINDAFLVSLFQILTETPTMTATEVIERTNEKGILLAPTVGRQESEYLGVMIDRELDVLNNLGMLPPMPPRLAEAGGEYSIGYCSPLAKAMKAQEAAGFIRTVETVKELVNITQDRSLLDRFDFDTAIPAIAQIQSVPESWMSDDEAVAQKRQKRQQAEERQQQIQEAPAKAAIIKAQAMAAKGGGVLPGTVQPGQAPASGGAPLAQQLGG